MAARGEKTVDGEQAARHPSDRPVPGLALIWSGDGPRSEVIALARGGVELGRGTAGIDDERASRRHVRVAFEAGRWQVRDLCSRNGTFLDGARIDDEATSAHGGLVRIGRSLLLLAGDVRPFATGIDTRGGRVVGPTLRRAWDEISRAAAAGDTLLLTGETGTGKQLAAHVFHDAGPSARGPFVAVDCATVPEGAAERLLFGATKGVSSGGRADVEGCFRAANGGTLFLEELVALEVAVQVKLLRALETRMVTPLGATQGISIDVRVCAATSRDVRRAVADGALRRDLYFRIGRPEVWLPPLRARVEEIPWLIARALADVDPGLRADLMLVERASLAPWPGNVRELLGAVRRAAHAAHADGRVCIEARDLGPGAARALDPSDDGSGGAAWREPTFDEVEAALRAERGNVTGAAKRLGLHRDQLQRWLAEQDLDPRSFGDAPDDGDDRG